MKCSLDSYSASFERLKLGCEDAQEAINLVGRLDGKVHTELTFDDGCGWTLVVGGGPLLYVAVKFDVAGRSFAYLDPETTRHEPVELCVGGQLGEYDPRYVCSHSIVSEAINDFFVAPNSAGARWERS